MNLRMHAADVVSPVIINHDSESHHTAISPDSMLDTVSTQCPSIISIPSSFFRVSSLFICRKLEVIHLRLVGIRAICDTSFHVV